jgi:hypothetical protein
MVFLSKCSCGQAATHVVNSPFGLAICCEEHASEWNPEVVQVTPLTPEMDAIIAERQTPEGDKRWRTERENFTKKATAKLLTDDAVSRALKLMEERRCGFCESIVATEDGFLEIAAFDDGRLSRPNYRDKRFVAYLTHVGCSPIEGYYLPLSGITREGVESDHGTRRHLRAKNWGDGEVFDRALDILLATPHGGADPVSQ